MSNEHVNPVFNGILNSISKPAELYKSQSSPVWVSVENDLPEAYEVDGKKKKVNWVLGTNGKDQFICVHTIGYELEYEDFDPREGDYDEIEERNGTRYLKPGFYELTETPGGEYDETWQKRQPTHWMPLPLSPNESPKESGLLETEDQGQVDIWYEVYNRLYDYFNQRKSPQNTMQELLSNYSISKK